MKITGQKIYDISPEISQETAVFPGDTVFTQTILMDCKKGDHLGLSSFTTTPHIGAHVDAPNHYHRDGVGISERALDFYMGDCQVITVDLQPGTRIMPTHISSVPLKASRVLFKTNSYPDAQKWTDDFCALSPELIEFLAQHRVCLVGIDTPSVDLAQDKELRTHLSIFKHNMAILEGIILTSVPDGLYTLVALPLKMKNLDASPVRAVLVEQ